MSDLVPIYGEVAGTADDWVIVDQPWDMTYKLRDVKGNLHSLGYCDLAKYGKPGDTLPMAFARALLAKRNHGLPIAGLEQ